jgi:pimeloyl-ACP methyl ester carboxylesterase
LKAKTIETYGAKVRVLDSAGGAEPVLIFLHYWGGSARTWSEVFNRLSARHRCIALDQRGWGASVVTDERYDLQAMAEDVEVIVKTLGLARYVLVGHSMGGKVAQLVAARQPEGLVGLVLVAPAPPEPMAVPAAQRAAMLDSYQSREGVLGALDILSGSMLPDTSREQVIEDTLAGHPEAKRAWTERGMLEDIGAHSQTITVPLLVVVGDRDKVEKEDSLRAAFGRRVPPAHMAVLPGVGHLSPLEAPDALAKALQPFLTAL